MRSSARSTSARGSSSRPTSITSATPTGCCATCRSRGSAWTSPAACTGRSSIRTSTSTAAGTTREFIAGQDGLEDQWLFAGIVDGRNVWINHLEHSLDALDGLQTRTAQLVVSTSCSLLHTPIDLDAEPSGVDADLDDEMRSWMAFATRRWARSPRWPRASPRGARRSPTSSMPTIARGIPGETQSGRGTPRSARGSTAWMRSTTSARAPSRSASRRSAPASTSRSSSPRPRSARIRKPARSARRG